MTKVHNHDVIGPLRGRAKALETLLSDLGYSDRGGPWRHPSRHAVFLGGYVDGGPEPLRALAIAVRMRKSGAATLLMGTAELRLLGFATPDPANPGRHVRPRRGEGWRAHIDLLARFGGPDSVAHRELADLYATMPLWFETNNFRAVSACWDRDAARTLAPHLDGGLRLTTDGLVAASLPGSRARGAVEVLLGGPTVRLPEGMTSTGPDGIASRTAHLRWWARGAATYHDALTHPEGSSEALAEAMDGHVPVPVRDARPTLFGRYALPGPLALTAPDAACLDVSDPDLLVAYRYDGERELRPGKFTKAREPRPAPPQPVAVPDPIVAVADRPKRKRRPRRRTTADAGRAPMRTEGRETAAAS